MTMFTLPNFCRVCLKYDKNLIDLAHIENEPNETLISKLQLCVSEVEWTTYKPLLCHPCIKRLNIAYSFKKQCVQSAGVLKNYVELVKESQKKNESPSATNTPQGGTFMILPNHKYVKILVGPQNQGTTSNSFQNVFLNLIPATSLTAVPSIGGNSSDQKNKDTNQNLFLNINNTFQKLVPITSISPLEPPPLKPTEPVKLLQASKEQAVNLNVDQLLTSSNAEEMSVEIDPTSFLSVEHDHSNSGDESKNDWDEVITKQKIDHKTVKVNGTSNGKNTSGNFVPILPKEDFFMSGAHFLSGSLEEGNFSCEMCEKSFLTVRLLKQHFKEFHLGKLPFKCEYCYSSFLTRPEFEHCMKSHILESSLAENNSLTLKDFSEKDSFENDSLSMSIIAETPADHNLFPNENGDFVCHVCSRVFHSSSGLLRHKVRKHHQKNRKKYFIKGMKNATCDICNRDFSTQSYLQQHKKLHFRNDAGYKYKVLGKNKYKESSDVESEDQKPTENGETEMKKGSDSNDANTNEQEESDTNSENEAEPEKKKQTEQLNEKENSTSSNDINMCHKDNESGASDDGDDKMETEEDN
ncbi:uncharacterized protein LOC115881270 [Sitophilus oryzae]|uniref:Uncharacterized protein LOC115881270 n=1 Tax=Sitophilus oryzae TaxID=7048 RepID=A0A6J2XSR0_SITOR|nr:uncharacterized protein LOC115881270 [Sitophilus oryzae]